MESVTRDLLIEKMKPTGWELTSQDNGTLAFRAPQGCGSDVYFQLEHLNQQVMAEVGTSPSPEDVAAVVTQAVSNALQAASQGSWLPWETASGLLFLELHSREAHPEGLPLEGALGEHFTAQPWIRSVSVNRPAEPEEIQRWNQDPGLLVNLASNRMGTNVGAGVSAGMLVHADHGNGIRSFQEPGSTGVVSGFLLSLAHVWAAITGREWPSRGMLVMVPRQSQLLFCPVDEATPMSLAMMTAISGRAGGTLQVLSSHVFWTDGAHNWVVLDEVDDQPVMPDWMKGTPTTGAEPEASSLLATGMIMNEADGHGANGNGSAPAPLVPQTQPIQPHEFVPCGMHVTPCEGGGLPSVREPRMADLPRNRLPDVLIVAEPWSGGPGLLDVLAAAHYGVINYSVLPVVPTEQLVEQEIRYARGNNPQRPVAVLVEPSVLESRGVSGTKVVRRVMAKLLHTRALWITRRNRALQATIEWLAVTPPEADGTLPEYAFAAIKRNYTNSLPLMTRIRPNMPVGNRTMEAAQEDLAGRWGTTLGRFSAFLGAVLQAGPNRSGAEFEDGLVRQYADHFQHQIQQGGRHAAVAKAVTRQPTAKQVPDATLPHLARPRSAKQQVAASPINPRKRGTNPAQMPSRPRPSVKAGAPMPQAPLNRVSGHGPLRTEPTGSLAPAAAERANRAAMGKKKEGLGYWEGRQGMEYYRRVVELANQFGAGAQTVLDVGGRDCEYSLEINGDPAVTLVDPDRGLHHPRVHWIQADFMQWLPEQPIYDIVICLQVMEHLKNPGPFIKKLISLGRVVICSLPHNWPKTHDHSQHKLPLGTFEKWSGRAPDILEKVKEPGRNQKFATRMVAVYRNDTAH